MSFYPVIMCGGSGTRLWPASRPSRPKQFIPLAGNRSLFQDTVLRVAPLVSDGGRLVVVAGVSHRDWIVDQLAEVDVEAQVLLEPEARDSAAAMGAAAAWVSRKDPNGVIAFVASDHHIPDDTAFQKAVVQAAEAARQGRIVTLGVRPRHPSSAYGYIRPSGPGLSDVAMFREKPDVATAEHYVEAGYLWNSGNFIVTADTFLNELRELSPGVEAAARAALPAEDGLTVQTLSDAFIAAPRISVDYAVMEKTEHASVLEVDFAWSDLGAWDSIAATGEGDTGQHIFEDSEGCLVRASEGVLVAAVGVRNLAIVAEPDAILICDLARAQDVKRLVERIKVGAPQYLDFAPRPHEGLSDGARRFAEWMRLRALPAWCTLGMGSNGAFAEALSLDGRAIVMSRRARVQARQIYAYAQAGLLGWDGPWRDVVGRGLNKLFDQYLRDDGLCRTTLAHDGSPLDETAMVYDQAFVLLALATAKQAGIDEPTLEARALKLRERLLSEARPDGSLREGGSHPFQANAHMHLLEACHAWEAAGGDAEWAAWADRIVDLAEHHFIDAEQGFLREFFDDRWRPAEGEDGRLIEPGHQFEWAWLLERHARARKRPEHSTTARRLYAQGRRGVSESAGVAMDALDDDFTVRSARARLWPQTEWLKASLLLAERARDGERTAFLADAAAAQRAMWLYLTDDGLWHDKRLSKGGFLDEPAPASSFYHLMAAFRQVCETGREEGLDAIATLNLR